MITKMAPIRENVPIPLVMNLKRRNISLMIGANMLALAVLQDIVPPVVVTLMKPNLSPRMNVSLGIGCPTTCGYTEDFDHSFYDWIAEDAFAHIHECMECDYISRLPHDYVMEVTKAPTAIENGEATYTCSLCSHIYVEVLPRRIELVENIEIGCGVQVPIGSNAYIPEGTVFDVVEVPAEEVSEEVLGEIAVEVEGGVKPLAMYDLALLLNGVEVQPDGTIEVTLPALQQEYDYDSITVVYIAPDGSIEVCDTIVNEDGSITFKTNHFSRYAVIGVNFGLGAGAIAGIVIGSVFGAVALSVGGFAIFWFVIKKKTMAELLALIKKAPKAE